MRTIHFVIPGPPVGKERARKGRGGHWYTPTKTKAYEEQVQAFLLDAYPDIESVLTVCQLDIKHQKNDEGEEELLITLTQLDEMPEKYKGPDGDNIMKIVGDALQSVGYKNDHQIVWWSYSREL